MTDLDSLNINVDIQKGGFFEGSRLVFKSNGSLIKDATFQGKKIKLNPIDYQEHGIKLAGFFEKAFGYAQEIQIGEEIFWVNTNSLAKFLDRTVTDLTYSKNKKSIKNLNAPQLISRINCVTEEESLSSPPNKSEASLGNLYVHHNKVGPDYGKLCLGLLKHRVKASFNRGIDLISKQTNKVVQEILQQPPEPKTQSENNRRKVALTEPFGSALRQHDPKKKGTKKKRTEINQKPLSDEVRALAIKNLQKMPLKGILKNGSQVKKI